VVAPSELQKFQLKQPAWDKVKRQK
jgi:hypothetical protein